MNISTRPLLNTCSHVIRRFCAAVPNPTSAADQPSTASATPKRSRTLPKDGPGLSDFIGREQRKRLPKVIPKQEESDSYLRPEDYHGEGRKVKFVTYGCQMNVNDMEVVRSLVTSNGYIETEELNDADVVLLMTCSIREGAEEKVWRELKRIRNVASSNRAQTVGVLGCMAERVRHDLLAKKGLCDVVAGPDAYRDLPRLLAVARSGTQAINVQLSLEETYADVTPVRVDPSAKSAFVSIMRGCDNMCTYCVVPLTRGRERSRAIDSIIDEVRALSDQGVKQVVLLGQNVNSYRDKSDSQFVVGAAPETGTVAGFSTVYRAKHGGRAFLTLLDEISRIDPEMRIRFTSPHPKDFPMEVISLIRERANICNQLHLPAQSGDDATLERMGRGYTRDTYLRLVDHIRAVIPDVHLTSDFIAGFCGETEEAHQLTVDLIRRVGYSFCYVFPYSMRSKTRADYRLVDDVPEDVKRRRHEELAAAFREGALRLNESLVGSSQLVLVEGRSKRSESAVVGRADGGTKVIVENRQGEDVFRPGDYVHVNITHCTSQTLFGAAVGKTTLTEYTRRM